MSDVRIRFLANGPIEVSGTTDLVDADGQAHAPAETPVYLCRCGRSATKPFCDGSHRKTGFVAEPWKPA